MPSLTYYPDPGFEGEDTFSYRVTNLDGEIGEATVTVNVVGDTVQVIDDSPPLISLGSYVQYELAANDVGIGQGSTFEVVDGTLPQGLSLSSAGVLTGLATAEYRDSVRVKITSSVDGAVFYSQLSMTVQLTQWSGDAWKSPAFQASIAGETDAQRLSRARLSVADWEQDYVVSAAEMAAARDGV